MKAKTMMWVGMGLTVTTVAALIWYVDREGIDQAASLFGVIGFIITLVGVVLTIYSIVLQRREPSSDMILTGLVDGPVSMVRNSKGVSIKSSSATDWPPSIPDAAPRTAPTDRPSSIPDAAPRAAPTGSMHASGTFFGPVHMVDGGEEVEIE